MCRCYSATSLFWIMMRMMIMSIIIVIIILFITVPEVMVQTSLPQMLFEEPAERISILRIILAFFWLCAGVVPDWRWLWSWPRGMRGMREMRGMGGMRDYRYCTDRVVWRHQ